MTCQTLPPDFPGYDPYCPFTLAGGGREEWSAPDVLEAQRLVAASGTAGARVVVPTQVETRSLDRQLVDLLDTLGYRASPRPLPDAPDAYTYLFDHQVRAGVSGWGGADFPGQADYLTSLITCASRPPAMGWNLSRF